VETIVCSRSFDSDLRAMVDRCRSLDSRELWPGVVPDANLPNALYYTIGIRLKSASMTDMQVEERLGPEEQEGDAIVFASAHRCTWPDLVVNAESEYRFHPGSPNVLQFTYRYDNPGSKIVKGKDLPAFRGALEKVIGRYLDRLTSAVLAR
jgi:hypothetical protein